MKEKKNQTNKNKRTFAIYCSHLSKLYWSSVGVLFHPNCLSGCHSAKLDVFPYSLVPLTSMRPYCPRYRKKNLETVMLHNILSSICVKLITFRCKTKVTGLSLKISSFSWSWEYLQPWVMLARQSSWLTLATFTRAHWCNYCKFSITRSHAGGGTMDSWMIFLHCKFEYLNINQFN